MADSQPGKPPVRRVLLAEDDEVNRFVATSILLQSGYAVEGVTDGADAVLMDCEMAEVDGFEATAQIRADEAARGQKRVPIVALTAHAMQGDREDCLAAGMDDYLAKPFKQQSLRDMLEKWAGPAVAG